MKVSGPGPGHMVPEPLPRCVCSWRSIPNRCFKVDSLLIGGVCRVSGAVGETRPGSSLLMTAAALSLFAVPSVSRLGTGCMSFRQPVEMHYGSRAGRLGAINW
jgi:hypothetical protein